MAANTRIILLHAGSAAAGAIAAVGFLSTHAVDLYAIWNQLNETFASITKLIAMVTPLVTGGYAVYKATSTKAKLQDALADPKAPEIAASLPVTPQAQAVAKALTSVLLAGFFILLSTAAFAQTPKKPIFPIPNPFQQRTDSTDNVQGAGGGARGLPDILTALDAKLLPDLQYALKLAQASNSKVTAPCYSAWIDIITTRQKAAEGPDGQSMPMPDPHIVTDFEKMVELRNALQPDAPFMIACSPVASMVKKDILGFIGIVIGGGAGLATLVPGL